jgi:imidazolonepropionase-like amidohydrolase
MRPTKLERKVAAHAHGTEGIKIATRAGVASIEHGSFLDEEGAKLMAQKGTFLVPTLSAGETVERAAKSGVLKGFAPKSARSGCRDASCDQDRSREQVMIALGTDAA